MSQVPHGRLLAEIEAWPLGSVLAYEQRTTQLVRTDMAILNPATARLAAGLDEHLRIRASGMSLANLSVLRDSAWFLMADDSVTGPCTVTLARYLVQRAELYLERGGIRTVLNTDASEPGRGTAERAAHWRWLSLRLPCDLLVSALYAPNSARPPTDHVSIATEHLRRVLKDQPVADSHLHVGAAFGFPVLWSTWMVWLARNGPIPSDLSDEHVPFGTGEAFRGKLLAAALCRLFLASFLRAREVGATTEDFGAFSYSGLRRICERLDWPEGEKLALQVCHQALADVAGTAPGPAFANAQLLYSQLCDESGRMELREYDDLFRADPLDSWLQPQRDGACCETLFASRALRYLLQEGSTDAGFAEIFWQYQRIRCLAHSYLVQEPGTSGLDWFRRFYDRISALRGPLDGQKYVAALQHQSVDLTLGALEVRTAPPSDWTEIRDEVRRLASAGEQRRPTPGTDGKRPELGLVFHFIKRKQARGTNQLYADPSQDPTGYRHGSWFSDRRREVLALQEALENHPELLLLIRGMDVASSELAVPTWATVELLASVRQASVTASEALRQLRPSWNVPPMRLTCHVGEEFSRLVEGVRRVHELYEAGLLRNGDRIGHGLALGIVPRLWADSATLVVQTAEDRLDDLLWELDRYGSGNVPAHPGRVERVRAEADRLAWRIYGDANSNLTALSFARRRRHQPNELLLRGFPDGPTLREDPLPLSLYLTDSNVFRRGQQPVEVRVDDAEVRFLEDVQRWLRSELARLEITVETNPSSNLLIGDLLGVEEHPVFQLAERWLMPGGAAAETGAGGGDHSELLVSINSDDPITFATRLADEYTYLYFALLRRRVPSARALGWMDELRARGMRARFTAEASADQSALQLILSTTSPVG
ncbi:hypothetical protein [Archangium lansingense]|uniref:Adenosine deaminase n=1 Tax=Archangium lansingense TaxID=2995310 RepID=A0ABT4AIY0_9BACT|nr:hypothetical protein [Archangium lansinium]MCY1081261.1 hypothetical protein [Archangium lansinium]